MQPDKNPSHLPQDSPKKIGITIGDVLFFASLNRLGASLEAIAGCMYSPIVMLLAFVLFGESMTPMGFVGAALVVGAILLDLTRFPAHIEKRPP